LLGSVFFVPELHSNFWVSSGEGGGGAEKEDFFFPKFDSDRS